MIKFLKIRDVASPERENGNAGIDFFVPKFDEDFIETCKKEAEKIPGAAVRFAMIIDDNGNSKRVIEVNPHSRVNIPSGIKSYLKLGMPLSSYNLEMDLYVENKSGIATKKGIDVGACEVDPNYQGEIHISVTNTTNETIYINEGDKIVQLVPRVYCTDEPHVFYSKAVNENGISEEEFWKDFEWTNRGTGGFGSTSDKARS